MPVIRKKNQHKKIPRVSSVAKLWTEASNPDRIEKVNSWDTKKYEEGRYKNDEGVELLNEYELWLIPEA